MKHAIITFATMISGCAPGGSPVAPQAEPKISQSGAWIIFDGPISRASGERFREFATDRTLSGLSINSGGGDVEAALEIGQLVRDRNLEVRVRTWCMSSCANYIFTSGTRKTIEPGAVVGWHGSPSHLYYLDRVGSGSKDPVIRQFNEALARREAAFLRAMGVDPFVSWFGKLPPYNVPNFYALSVADMNAFGIGNVSAPQLYGPNYSLQEGIQKGLVFISANPKNLKSKRPEWLK